jgi:hypothetical protein
MNCLHSAIAVVCRSHLLEPKLLVAPSLRVAHQWLEHVVRHGTSVVNVQPTTLQSLAIDLPRSGCVAIVVLSLAAEATRRAATKDGQRTASSPLGAGANRRRSRDGTATGTAVWR